MQQNKQKLCLTRICKQFNNNNSNVIDNNNNDSNNNNNNNNKIHSILDIFIIILGYIMAS